MSTPAAATFRDAYLAARRRIEAGTAPEAVVPQLLELAEAQEEIDLAGALFGDAEAEEDDTWR